MNKAWLLTDGCYSDYRIVAVFTSIELAEAAKAAGVGEDIEEHDLDPEFQSPPAGMKLWHVCLDQDGSLPVFSNGRTSRPYVGSSHIGTELQKAKCVGRTGGGWYAFNCWARDEEHAIKIANELRVQAIANEVQK
jgi:hypothetical protein